MPWSFPLNCRPLRPFDAAATEAQQRATSLEAHDPYGVRRRNGALVHLDLGTVAGRARLGEVDGPIGVTIRTDAPALPRAVAALAGRVPVGLTVERMSALGFLKQLADIVALDVVYGESLAALRHLTRLESLHLEHTRPGPALEHVARCPDLRQLSFYGCRVQSLAALADRRGLRALRVHQLGDSAELRHLAGLDQLEELELQIVNLAFADLAHLARLPALRRLELTVGTFRPLAAGESPLASLAAIATGCPRLEHLAVRDDALAEKTKRDVDPHHDGAAIEMPALRTLDLRGCRGGRTLVEHLVAPALTRLAFDGDKRPPLGWLARLPTIENLLLCSELDDAAVAELRRMPALRELFLMGTKISDAGVAHLAGLRLTSLWLNDTRIGDAGVAHLAGMPLRQLALDETKITDAAGPALAALPALEELDLSSSAVGDGVLAHLARLPRLRALDLTRTQVTDAGLAHLVGLAATLEELQLDRCGALTDAGMAHLGKLTSLTFLSLRDMNWVTNAGVDHLVGLTRLRRLNIYSEESTAEGEARLQAALPLLSIDA
jgi:hypothetical protein